MNDDDDDDGDTVMLVPMVLMKEIKWKRSVI